MKVPTSRVLVTGASGGIGQAIIAALNGCGAATMGVSRRPSDSHDRAGANAQQWVQADLTNVADLQRVAAAAAAFRVNVVIHAAGVPAFGALSDCPLDQIEPVLRLNLWAPIALTRLLLPHLLGQQEARLVFVGSVLGRIGLPGSSLYGASKSGLHLFSEALRRELGQGPVRVQWLAPRATRTGFNSAASQQFNTVTGSRTDPPEAVAAALIGLLQSGAGERTVGYPEKIVSRINAAAGPLLDSAFRPHRLALEQLSAKGVST